jgi:hypothetical protein
MKKETYKDYVYFKMPKEKFKEYIQKAKKVGSKNIPILSLDDLLIYKAYYENDIQTKQKGAIEAHKRKKAKTDLKILKALEDYYTGLFKNDYEKLTPAKLSKLAKVNYRTAKRFFEEYNLPYWIEEFGKRGSNALREFKYQELAESLVYGRNKKAKK